MRIKPIFNPSVHCVFLRAIGPVTHKLMPLRELCSRCEAAGFISVTSVLATGNLILVGSGDQGYVADAISDCVSSFGLNNSVFVRSPLELSKIVKANPFPDAAENHPHHLVVHFLQAPPQEAVLATVLAHPGPERVVAKGRDLYVDYPVDIGHSKLLPSLIERKLKQVGTARNWNTVVKVLALATQLEATLQSGMV